MRFFLVGYAIPYTPTCLFKKKLLFIQNENERKWSSYFEHFLLMMRAKLVLS
jgi:hypothetical protein